MAENSNQNNEQRGPQNAGQQQGTKQDEQGRQPQGGKHDQPEARKEQKEGDKAPHAESKDREQGGRNQEMNK